MPSGSLWVMYLFYVTIQSGRSLCNLRNMDVQKQNF